MICFVESPNRKVAKSVPKRPKVETKDNFEMRTRPARTECFRSTTCVTSKLKNISSAKKLPCLQSLTVVDVVFGVGVGVGVFIFSIILIDGLRVGRTSGY